MSETLDYVTSLFGDSPTVGLIHQAETTITQWFTEADKLLERARELHRRGNLYTTINHIDCAPPLPTSPTRNIFRRYSRILIDIHPVRPAGLPATEDELNIARYRAEVIMGDLSCFGWPRPAVGVSGNGAHLIYRTALPGDVYTRSALAAIHKSLSSHYDDHKAYLAPMRGITGLAPLYGSIKRTGKQCPDRPYRKTSVSLPWYWAQVTRQQVKTLLYKTT